MFIFAYFGPKWQFSSFFAILDQNLPFGLSNGTIFIGNHTGNRLKVVPKSNFPILTTKIAKNAKNLNFDHILGYK